MNKLRSLLLDEEFTIDQSTKTMQNRMPTVINSTVISGIPTFNHYNTPITSTVHHFNAQSPSSTTHFGIPQNDMISSTAINVPNVASINVPNAASSCQDMILRSTNFGASQTMLNSGYMLNNNAGHGNYFPAPTLSYDYAPQIDGFMPQNGTFITSNGIFMAQNGGYTHAFQHNYSQQGFSQNNVSQQQGSLSQQQGSFSQAPNNNYKNGPTAMVAHNSFNNFEVTLLHSSSSHLDSVAPIDAQRFPTSKMEIKLESFGESFTIADESEKDPVHDVGSQIAIVPSKDGILYAQEDSDHKEPIVLSRDGHELSQSTVLESALQPWTNAATRNGFSENEKDKGSKLEVLSRFELSPNIVGKGGSRKQNSESPRLAENVSNRVNASTEQAEAQPQLKYGQETMELLSKNQMNCRQYCQPMQLWPSLPLIPPG